MRLPCTYKTDAPQLNSFQINLVSHQPQARVGSAIVVPVTNQKPKGNKTRNDDRKNGKAKKNPDGNRHRRTPQDDVQLVLLGKGMFRQVSDRVSKDQARVGASKRRLKDSED